MKNYRNRLIWLSCIIINLAILASVHADSAIPIDANIYFYSEGTSSYVLQDEKSIDADLMDTMPFSIEFRPVLWALELEELNFEHTKGINSEFIEATYPLANDEFLSTSNYVPHFMSLEERIPLIGVSILLINLYKERALSFATSFVSYPQQRVIGVVSKDTMAWLTKGPNTAGVTNPFFPIGGLITPNIMHVGAHEIGHTYGLCDEYSYCAWLNLDRSLSGGCPNKFPYDCTAKLQCNKDLPNYSDCTHDGSLDINGFWVARKREMYTGRKTEDYYNKVYNFMGNSDPMLGYCTYDFCRWVSKETYEQLLSKFEYPDFFNSSFQADSSEVLLVSGLADKNGSVGLDDLYLIEEGQSGDVMPGSYSLKLLDGSGTVLSDTNFGVSFTLLSDPPIDLNTTFFAFSIPFAEGTKKIAIDYNGERRAERTISAHAPTVSVTSPAGGETWTGTHEIVWEGSDADHDELSYVLQYSADDGNSWNPLAIDVNEGRYDWDTGWAEPGGNYRVKVIATDGVLTGEGISGKFTIRNPDIDIKPAKWGNTVCSF